MVTHSSISSPCSLILLIGSMSSSTGTGSSGFFDAFFFLFASMIASLALSSFSQFSTSSAGKGNLPIKLNIGMTISVVRKSLLRPKYSILRLPFIIVAKASNDGLPRSGLLLISKTLIVVFAFKAGLMATKSSSVSQLALRKRTCNFFEDSTLQYKNKCQLSVFTFKEKNVD